MLEALQKNLTPDIYRIYASTDSGQMAISKPGDALDKANSAGRPVWCVALHIVDDDGKPGQSRRCRRDYLPKSAGAHGYYKNPHATVSFCDDWFYTGDLGYFDEEGYLFDSGRKKDMLKSGGISIYALEIESVICSHSDILEAAVIGVPDAQWGEALKAVIVLKRRG